MHYFKRLRKRTFYDFINMAIDKTNTAFIQIDIVIAIDSIPKRQTPCRHHRASVGLDGGPLSTPMKFKLFHLCYMDNRNSKSIRPTPKDMGAGR